MATTNFAKLLAAHGWASHAEPGFAEKAGRGASAYYSYQNARGNRLTLAVMEADKVIRFRIFDPNQDEPAWFQIALNGEEDKVVGVIDERKEEITRDGAFGFYFSISEFEGVSILAWEQWEDDYQ